jgi:tetratricopeptide (TPR) repeat protein
VSSDFEYWRNLSRRAQTSGLYVMEASSAPVSPSLRLDDNNQSLAKALDSIDLKIAGASVNMVARACTAFLRWWVPHPTEIKGFVYQDPTGQLSVRLTVRLPQRCWTRRQLPRPSLTVSASAANSGEDSLQAISKEVTFKMLYALAKGEVQSAQLANDVRVGLDELRSYLNAADAPIARLEKSRATFARVRTADPEFLEARLYEGIALDLLERHEEAAAQFAYVKAQTKDASNSDQKLLHEQAQYNEAVANLRNLYGLEAMDRAIKQLNELLGQTPDARSKPLHALATVTLADAWANRVIQWKKIAGSADPKLLHDILSQHEKEVMPRVESVRQVLDSVDLEIRKGDPAAAHEVANGWNTDTRRQVRWGVHNALADYYLYAAVQLQGAGEHYGALLEQAIKELGSCEMLLPPGVETLSNAGTALYIRGNADDLRKAREYLKRAITLNDRYEYAYYRLAQAWEKDQWREKVIETLESFPWFPEIPEFHSMFTKYFVTPKSS